MDCFIRNTKPRKLLLSGLSFFTIMLKLYVYDSGDPSAGIFATQYSIDCPFDTSADDDVRSFFIECIGKAYSEYADGRLMYAYSDEELFD